MPHQNFKSIQTLKQINANLTYDVFKWYELGILGVGKSGAPFADMSPWVDFENDLAKQAEQEIKSLLGNFKFHHMPRNSSYVPEDVIDKKWINYYVWRIEDYIPADILASFTKGVEVAAYLYNNNITRLNWKQMSYIVKPSDESRNPDKSFNFSKLQTGGSWVEDVPAFKAWVESWDIFDGIGRIVVFENAPGEDVSIHRDVGVNGNVPNTIHNLTIQFKKDRPTFVYDEVTKTKIYHNTRAYCFNVQDNHGVDAQDTAEFTIRIDGIFKPEICEALGLVNGAIWCKDYPTYSKLRNIQIYEPEERP